MRELRGFPGGASGKEPACQCRRHKRCGFDPWVGKTPWRRAWQPIQYSYLESPVDRGAWWVTGHGVCKESDMTEATWHAHQGTKIPHDAVKKKKDIVAIYTK